MENRLAIAVVVDGLRASALGTYGNTVWPTPRLDAIASRWQVADWHFVDCPTLAGFYAGAWAGTPGWQALASAQSPRIFTALQSAGVSQCLLTDDAQVAQFADEAGCQQVLLAEPAPPVAVTDVEQTQLVRFFAQAMDQLAGWHQQITDQGKAGLLWIHSTGLTGPWDAPAILRVQLQEEGDPDLLLPGCPPQCETGIDDPDQLLGYRTAYGAQLLIVDECLGQLLEEVERIGAGSPCLSLVTGARGFALGEHGTVGYDHTALFGEMLQVPLLLQSATSSGGYLDAPRQRWQGFSGPADLFATLCEWFQLVPSPACPWGRSLPAGVNGETAPRAWALAGNIGGERALRTPAWLLMQSPASTAPPVLFAKPDDRWEANDIAVRCPEIVTSMQSLLAQLERSSVESSSSTDRQIPDELCRSHW